MLWQYREVKLINSLSVLFCNFRFSFSREVILKPCAIYRSVQIGLMKIL